MHIEVLQRLFTAVVCWFGKVVCTTGRDVGFKNCSAAVMHAASCDGAVVYQSVQYSFDKSGGREQDCFAGLLGGTPLCA
jgi:hypothetical protein